VISLLAAFQFLTISPPLVRRAFTDRELGRSVGWYPLVGLALGGALYGLAVLADPLFPQQVLAILLLAGWVIATRALHLDGFMDMCDGLFGGFTPERRLEIMRDSRVGAFGVAGGMLLLLTKFTLISATLPDHRVALLIAPVTGRWVISLAVVLFPYARPTGMGRTIKNHAGWPQALLSALVLATAALSFAGLPALLAAALSGGLVLLWLLAVRRMIPGLTGDLYGAACELAEVLVMVLLTLRIAP
jgi:adenosylcobinamide-GDP ribazoletransferase